jgi:hypothetical protein
MEFPEALTRAWTDIEGSAIPKELQEAALVAGLSYYLGNSSSSASPGAPMVVSGTPNPPTAALMVSDGDAGSRLASETGIDRELLDELIYFDAEDAPGLNGGARRLGKNNAERSRAVALILAGARHFANDELEVPLDPIREACKQLGIYDQNNFASYMADVPGFILAGPRSSRVLRAKSDAAMRFRQKIQEVVGGREN